MRGARSIWTTWIAIAAVAAGCAEITGIEPGHLADTTSAGSGATGGTGGVAPMPCTTDDDCSSDTHCVNGACVPWPDGGHDDGCINVAPLGVLAPSLRCEFVAAPPGDPFPDHLGVRSMPIVANFHPASGEVASIAALFASADDQGIPDQGVLRILRGDDCTVEAVLGGVDLDGDGVVDWLVSTATPAAGDLDGDGIPDVVVYGADGATLAFSNHGGAWHLLWKSSPVAGQLAHPCNVFACDATDSGVSIHDLDGDGIPEVIRESAVLDAQGVVLRAAASGYVLDPSSLTYHSGLPQVLGHFHGDASVQLTNGSHMWTWDATSKDWVADTGYAPPAPATGAPATEGPTALADLDAPPDGVPEIVVTWDNQVVIYTLHGDVVMPPIQLPETFPNNVWGGGPPTIADFDGDGLPEIAVATQGYITVFDLDCGPSPRPGGTCALGPCDHLGAGVQCPAGGYVSWSRAVPNATIANASIAFDFEGDGLRELVYADGCFMRTYDAAGDVLLSLYRSGYNGFGSPIVADVNGDFRADLVLGSALPYQAGACDSFLDANGVDLQFPGARCASGADCFSGACDQGFCRCQSSAGCCAAGVDGTCLDQGFKCAPPPAGTPGTGNTCRAGYPNEWAGIRVYSDANDNWIRARQIWNQHAYSITNVNEDGTIPSAADWQSNWTTPGLDDYRESRVSAGDPQRVGDATVGTATGFTCGAGGATLTVPVCNRGASPIGAGLAVGFYDGTTKVCGTATSHALQPGECDTTVTCTWAAPPASAAQKVSITVVANDGGLHVECHGGNDHGAVSDVFCAP